MKFLVLLLCFLLATLTTHSVRASGYEEVHRRIDINRNKIRSDLRSCTTIECQSVWYLLSHLFNNQGTEAGYRELHRRINEEFVPSKQYTELHSSATSGSVTAIWTLYTIDHLRQNYPDGSPNGYVEFHRRIAVARNELSADSELKSRGVNGDVAANWLRYLMKHIHGNQARFPSSAVSHSVNSCTPRNLASKRRSRGTVLPRGTSTCLVPETGTKYITMTLRGNPCILKSANIDPQEVINHVSNFCNNYGGVGDIISEYLNMDTSNAECAGALNNLDPRLRTEQFSFVASSHVQWHCAHRKPDLRF